MAKRNDGSHYTPRREPVPTSEPKGRVEYDENGRVVIVYTPFCAVEGCHLTATDRSPNCWRH